MAYYFNSMGASYQPRYYQAPGTLIVPTNGYEHESSDQNAFNVLLAEQAELQRLQDVERASLTQRQLNEDVALYTNNYGSLQSIRSPNAILVHEKYAEILRQEKRHEGELLQLISDHRRAKDQLHVQQADMLLQERVKWIQYTNKGFHTNLEYQRYLRVITSHNPPPGPLAQQHSVDLPETESSEAAVAMGEICVNEEEEGDGKGEYDDDKGAREIVEENTRCKQWQQRESNIKRAAANLRKADIPFKPVLIPKHDHEETQHQAVYDNTYGLNSQPPTPLTPWYPTQTGPTGTPVASFETTDDSSMRANQADNETSFADFVRNTSSQMFPCPPPVQEHQLMIYNDQQQAANYTAHQTHIQSSYAPRAQSQSYLQLSRNDMLRNVMTAEHKRRTQAGLEANSVTGFHWYGNSPAASNQQPQAHQSAQYQPLCSFAQFQSTAATPVPSPAPPPSPFDNLFPKYSP